jgi:hypothetical protein
VTTKPEAKEKNTSRNEPTDIHPNGSVRPPLPHPDSITFYSFSKEKTKPFSDEAESSEAPTDE